jgi:hypothetical protein
MSSGWRPKSYRQDAIQGSLTGQDVTLAGVMGAAMGAVMAASPILRRNLLREVTSPADTRTGKEHP